MAFRRGGLACIHRLLGDAWNHAAGEFIDIERGGRLVATLGPPRRPTGTSRARLVEVFEHAEPLDVDAFCDDVYGDRGLDDSFGGSQADRQ